MAEKHHGSSSGVWLVFAKKHSGLPTVTYNDAVEEALCFGWIDGLMHPVDDTFYKQLFTPRKAKSGWAASNKARVEKMIAAGLMTDAGHGGDRAGEEDRHVGRVRRGRRDDAAARFQPRAQRNAAAPGRASTRTRRA